MLNKTRKLITGTALSLSAAALLLLFSATQATAAALSSIDSDGTTVLLVDDTIDAAAVAGATGRNISVNQANCGADTPTLIITGAGTVNLGGWTMNTADNSSDTQILTIGDGNAATVVIFNGNIVGDAANNVTGSDLDIIMDASHSNSGTNLLKLYGTVDAATVLSMDGDANGINTLQIGNGVDAVTNTLSVQMNGSTDAAANIVNIMANATMAGTIDAGLADNQTTAVINLAAGSIVSGAISDTQDGVNITINVDGDSTISSALDLEHTSIVKVAIDTGMTLTMSGTGAVKLDTGTSNDMFELTGTGTLKLTGAKTIVGEINGACAGDGTLDIDADTTFSSIVGATKVGTIDVGADTTFSAAVTATTLNHSADIDTTLSAATAAAITATTSGQGTIITAGDWNITGTIGTSDSSIKLFDSNGTTTVTGAIYATSVDLVNAKTLTAQGNITGAVNFSGDGSLTLADGVDITGNITATTTNNGNLTTGGANWSVVTGDIGATCKLLNLVDILGDDNLEVTGDIIATDLNIASGGGVKISPTDNTATLTKLTCAAACTVDIGSTTVAATGAVVFNTTGSTFKLTVGTADGTITGAGAVTGHAGNTLVPTVAGSIVTGEYLVIVTGDAQQAIPGTITDNYERYNFAVVNDTHASCAANKLCLVVTTVAPAGVSAAGAAISAISDVAFAADDSLSDAINGLSGAALDKALLTLAPSVDGGAIVGAVSAGAASGATISTQIASLRSGIAAGQGLNAGDGTAGEERFWTQGFGTYAEQDIREKIAGFTSTTGGVAFGVDQRFLDDLVLGVAYSFSRTNVNSSESKNETTVMSHQATLYGSHDVDKAFFQADGVFLDGQLSYAYNDYDGERNIDVGAVSRRADSAYEGLQISSKFDLGRTIKLDEGFRFTPTAGLSYSHVSIDSYSETNAGASNLKIQDQDYDILNLNLKGKIATTFQVDGLDLTPEIHLGYSYEVIHDKIQTISTFEGGGDAFTSTGFKPANSTYLGGIGMTWGGDSMPVDMTFTYDVSHKEDFLSHSALVKGVWRF